MKAKAAAAAGFLVCILLFALSLSAFIGNAIALSAPEPAAAEFAAQLAPADPFAYYSSSVLLDQSMRAEDLPKAMEMLEKTVALEPSNYFFWLELGKAKERNGNPDAAEKAFRHAVLLAPNYSDAQWALGNILIRRAKADEGFSHLRSAVQGSDRFAAPAASLAWALYEGDVEQVTRVIGDSGPVKASLANLLASQEKLDEALKIWKTLPRDEMRGRYLEAGKALLQELLQAKKFNAAVELQAVLSNEGPAVGKVSNGGFEREVVEKGSGPFDWTIGPGAGTAVGISVEQKRSGSRSLALIFGQGSERAIRAVAQAIAVRPATEYRFTAFYRSELQAESTLRWEIADAVTGAAIASTDPFVPKAGWTQASAAFTVPEGSEGVVVRLVRQDCGLGDCRITGTLWLDDVSISER